MRRLILVVDLAASNLGVREAVAKHIVEINPTLSLQQNSTRLLACLWRLAPATRTRPE